MQSTMVRLKEATVIGAALFLTPRTSWAKPAPLVYPPTSMYSTPDGRWTSFDLRIGQPAQQVGLLVSTASQYLMATLGDGCTIWNASNPCPNDLGQVFRRNQSKTSQNEGSYDTGSFEKNLVGDDILAFISDNVSLGADVTISMPTLKSQLVALFQPGTFAPNGSYFGLLGLSPAPVSLGNGVQYPTLFATLKSQGIIPSLTWSYTAGAYYSE